MKRRDFLKVLAGIAAAPLAITTAVTRLVKPEHDPYKRLAAKMFGSCTGRISCKKPNRANVMRPYSKADAERTLKMYRSFHFDSSAVFHPLDTPGRRIS